MKVYLDLIMTYFDLLFFYVSKVRFFRFLFVLFPVDVVPQDVPDSVHTQLASSTVKPTTTRNKIQIFDPTKTNSYASSHYNHCAPRWLNCPCRGKIMWMYRHILKPHLFSILACHKYFSSHCFYVYSSFLCFFTSSKWIFHISQLCFKGIWDLNC